MSMEVTNVGAESKWHPQFRQSIDTAIEALMDAKNKVTLERAAALDSVSKAEDELGYILVEWEEIPEPAADVIRGVLFETRAMKKLMEDADQSRGLNPDTVTGRLLDAIKGLEGLTT